MNKAESLISIEILSELLTLDPETGNLFWKKRDAKHFISKTKRSPEHRAANWNSGNAGKPALNCVGRFGHKTGRIFCKLIFAHRVVYALVNGKWPVTEIDHINGNPEDNRPSNLRDVTHKENLKNQKIRKNNSTGVNGVNFFKRDSKWVASITVDGKSIHLGYFETKELATNARIAANNSFAFHKNHGRKSA